MSLKKKKKRRSMDEDGKNLREEVVGNVVECVGVLFVATIIVSSHTMMGTLVSLGKVLYGYISCFDCR